jgi:carbonic anhydrase/acetyltransferase-like protein (isoleucine patch superfamily)
MGVRSILVWFCGGLVGCGTSTAPLPLQDPIHHIAPNVRTSFSPTVGEPRLDKGSFIHPLASVIGAVELGQQVFVAPGASVRGDEGQPIRIGAGSNIQDGVVVHALETYDGHRTVHSNLVTAEGKHYAVFIGRNVSLAHQSQVHGPAAVGDNTFVGMQSLVFRAEVGNNCVLEPRALVMGVKIAPGRYVPAGQVVRTQADADALPVIDDRYTFAAINDGVLHVNHELAEGYERDFPVHR